MNLLDPNLFKLQSPFILAPLAGVTDLPFRKICRAFGAALVYSEMVSAKALHYRDKKSMDLLITDEEDAPCVFQLFGAEPDIMAEAAALLEDKLNVALDINMGCPVPKVVKNGEGSALMQNPKLAAKIVSAMVKAQAKPVFVKMRSGWDSRSINAIEFAQAMEEAGASMIAVHGRTREQAYSGKADWDVIGEVKRAVSLPVAGSGDVLDAVSAVSMLRETGCDYVMVARGALGNPWIFREAELLLRGMPEEEVAAARPSLAEKGDVFISQLRAVSKLKGEHTAVLEMRKHAAWYFRGAPGSASFRASVNHIDTIEEMVLEVREFCEQSSAL